MGNSFAGLIAALSAAVKADLKIVGETQVQASFDDFALLIRHLPDAEQVLLAAAIADVDGEKKAEIYRQVALGQFLFTETRGASLAVDPGENFVCLQILFSERALTLENFPGLVENFLNAAERQRALCRQAAEGGEKREGDEPAYLPDADFLRI